MDAPQNSGQNQNNQNSQPKPQLSWSQPTGTTPYKPQQHTPPPTSQPNKVSSTSTASGETKSNTWRNVAIGVAALLVLGGVVWVIVGSKKASAPAPADTGSNQQQQNTQTAAGTAVGSTTQQSEARATFPGGSLVVPSPQSAGMEVAISEIDVSAPTWVVVYESYNGQPGNVLGAGLFLSDRSSGIVSLLRGTLPGQTYFVGEARDDGDRIFSKVNDPATRDTNGNPITLTFRTK